MELLKYLAEMLQFKVKKRVLLFVAALMWTMAGTILLIRAVGMMLDNGGVNLLYINCSILSGIFFYLVLFLKISNKHIRRIILLTHERPSVFAFFNIRSYLMMFLMITMGISIRRLGIISADYLWPFYMFMGTPLLLSAVRFYIAGFYYSNAKQKINQKL